MDKKKRKTKQRLLLVVIIFFSFFTILLDVGGYINFVSDGTAAVVNPIRYWGTSQGRKATTFLRDLSSISSMRDDNASLRGKVIDLESRLSDYEEVKRENEVLRDQINIVDDVTYQLIKADIVGGDIRASSVGEIFINRGSADGIEEGLSVSYKGYLVGKIDEVHKHSASISLVTSLEMDVPVVSEANRTKGVASGDVQSGITVTKILREENVDEGEKFLTSGIGGYPKGFIIGGVSEVVGEDSDVEKEARLEGFIDIAAIEEVFVLKYEAD